MLLDGGQGIAVLHLLDLGGHGKGCDPAKGEVGVLAPPEEAGSHGYIGQPRNGVSDLGGEELDEAPLGGGVGFPHRSG